MAIIKPLLAKILIQVGADEPKEIGTIEIPIEVSVTPNPTRGAMTLNIHSTGDPAEIANEVQKRINASLGN